MTSFNTNYGSFEILISFKKSYLLEKLISVQNHLEQIFLRETVSVHLKKSR